MMGKYEPLKRYLKDRDDATWDASFDDIERVLGFPLPASAYRHSAWWANETHGSHSHARGWRDAGWITRRVRPQERTVRFERESAKTRAPTQQAEVPDDLWERASRLSGITNREELMKAALTALIRREAAKGLIALGGTMPDFTVPPRERPTW